jgi:hypothetical protein
MEAVVDERPSRGEDRLDRKYTDLAEAAKPPMSLAAVPDDFNHQPERPKLRLVPPPRMTQRERVILSLIRCPADTSELDRS